MTPDDGRNSQNWQQLYEYWLSKRDGRTLPKLSALDPIIDIPHLVSHLIILDVLPDGYRYRLTGSGIARQIGGELAGKRVGSTTISREVIGAWLSVLDRARITGNPQAFVARLPPVVHTKQIALALPLSDDDGREQHILVGVYMCDDRESDLSIDGLDVTIMPD